MGKCDYTECSGDGTIQNSCSYCGFDYCGTHRLPERHNCPSISKTNTLGPDFRSEFDITTKTPDQEALCTNCRSAPVIFGEEFCEDCLPLMTGTPDNVQCHNCSNHTTSAYDYCLECRPRERTIDSKRPGVRSDGTLSGQNNGSNTVSSDDSDPSGIIALLKSVFSRG